MRTATGVRVAQPRYEPLGRIGVGGMAEVHLARSAAGELVAVKRLLANDDVEHLDLFLDEARIAARLDHANIVRVHEFGCDGGGPFLVLEYIPGRTLATVLRHAGRRGLPRPVAVWAVAELARALGHIHGATGDDGHPLETVHRDVNPANALVSVRGDVKLTDFGIARARDAQHRTRTGVVRGTTAYMSPEQLSARPIDGSTDVWSLGAILWEATLGRRLFEGDDPIAIQQRIHAGVVPAPSSIDPSYPADLEAIVLAALACDPASRPSAPALEARLRAHAADDDEARSTLATLVEACGGPREAQRVDATPAVPMRGALAGRSRLPRPAAAVALVAAGVAAIVAVGVLSGPGSASHLDDEVDQAWLIAQRGGHERARILIDDVLDRSADPGADARVLAVLVHWWLGTRRIDDLVEYAEASSLDAGQRGLVRTIRLLHEGRVSEAVDAARLAERHEPGAAELAYALGEALWHLGERAEGARWLATAIERDPRWQMAMHHTLDLWSARGDAVAIRRLAARLARDDAAAGGRAEIAALVAERRYQAATDLARDLTRRFPGNAAIWQAHAETAILAGDLASAEASATVAVRLWPIDDRDRGPRAVTAELMLYRGEEERYAQNVGARFSAGNVLRRAFWRDDRELGAPRPIRTDRALRGKGSSAMASPPLFECLSVLGAHRRGADATAFYEGSPYPEVRAYGAALAAWRAGELEGAVASFEGALAAATAETRPLLAYHLARLHRERGAFAEAATACEDVLRPRAPVRYRAVLARDCAAWTEDTR